MSKRSRKNRSRSITPEKAAKKTKRKSLRRVYKSWDTLLPFSDYLKAAGVKGSYGDYFKTGHWKKIKKRFCPPGSSCAACDIKPVNERSLNMHHQTYRRLGQELRDDIVLLCEPCHAKLHAFLDEQYPDKPVAFKAEKTPEAFPVLFNRPCPQKLSLPKVPKWAKKKVKGKPKQTKISIKSNAPIDVEIIVTQASPAKSSQEPENADPPLTKKEKKFKKTRVGIRHSNIDFSYLDRGFVYRRTDTRKPTSGKHEPSTLQDALKLGREGIKIQQAEQARSEPSAHHSAKPDFAAA